MNFVYCYTKFKIHGMFFYSHFNEEFENLFPEQCINIFNTDKISFKKAISQCDLIILPYHFLFLAERKGAPKNFCSFILDSNDFPENLYEEYLNIVLESDKKIIFLTYGMDLHNIGISETSINILSKKQAALAWFYEKEPVSFKNIPSKYVDPYMLESLACPKPGVNDPFENWKYLKEKFPIRIELPFALSAKDFLSTKKIWQSCVPGITYSTREFAIKSFRDAGLSVAPYKFLDKVYRKIWSKIPKNNISDTFFYSIRHTSQRFFVSHSQATFVCGAGARYPVFKFFEIPAAHSMMIAYPFSGMQDYGFEDGINVIYSIPEDAGKIIKKYLSNKDKTNKIVNNAAQLMQEKHTIEKRISDLLLCCKTFLQDKLVNAQFIEGNYIIEKNS